MDFVLMGAAGSIGSGVYNAMAMPPMGHVDIPNMPTVNMPQMPSIGGPPIPTMPTMPNFGSGFGNTMPITPQFGTGVGQMVNGMIGSNSLIGPTGLYPYTNPFPGYGPTGQIGVNPFVGIPSVLSSLPGYNYGQMLQGQQMMGAGPMMGNQPTYQNGAFYMNSIDSVRPHHSFGYCNPFMSAQSVGGFGAFYGGMRNAFGRGMFG